MAAILEAWGITKLLDSFYNALIPEERYLSYLSGLKVTLQISLFAVLIGVVIGVLVAIVRVGAKNSKNVFLKLGAKLCSLYVTILRGTPVIVQLLIIYNLVFTSRNTNAVVVGAMCFGINSGAYVSEIVRAGIESIDRGQMEAGRSLGFTAGKTMRYIILPQAVKNILPALGNEFIVMIKETSVISVIAVSDLTKNAQYIGSRTFEILPPLIIAAAIYLVLVIVLSKGISILERRLRQSDTN
jgi:His/Glu/Gln/Arg/opine family amino acid ABC transporter permease subunit